ncbi:ABC transporter substrate-binding protein [Lacrimispora sp.]|uniref:ABC transporter substrate-binding protein n=1 Tax=Lacrimispora sp. TaxID=2719234 RepID=UPI003460D352
MKKRGYMTGRSMAALALAAVMAVSMTGCGGTKAGGDATQAADAKTDGTESKKGSESGGEVLRVGVLPLSVGVPAQYAADQGWFEEEGLNVSLEYFATGAPVNEAIAAEELDIACSGFASIYSLANADCVWLADVNTTGGMGLYARSDSELVAAGKNLAEDPDIYGSAETLKGKQILEPLGTAVQYMTECYAAKFGLSPTDVEQVNMEYASAFQAFQTGEGDIAAMNPPYSYQMEDLGYTKVCSFEDATGVNMCDGSFARREVVENRSEDVAKFVKCLVRAMDELQDENTRYEYTKKFYTDNGQDFTEENLKKEIEDRKYVGTAFMSLDGYKLGEAWLAITDFLVSAEKIVADNAPNVEKSIDSTYVSEAAGITIK